MQREEETGVSLFPSLPVQNNDFFLFSRRVVSDSKEAGQKTVHVGRDVVQVNDHLQRGPWTHVQGSVYELSVLLDGDVEEREGSLSSDVAGVIYQFFGRLGEVVWQVLMMTKDLPLESRMK